MTSDVESVTLFLGFVLIRATWLHLPKHNFLWKQNSVHRCELVWTWISTATD